MHDPVVLRAVVDEAQARHWHAQIEAQAALLPAGHPDLQPTSGSMRLLALGPERFEALLGDVLGGAAGALVRNRLGPRPRVLARQCWARRQWPPSLRPAGQAPHAWHQDGALHARFENPGETLLPLQTVWVPLVACGADAPSLEWIDVPTNELLPPAALTDDAVHARHGPGARRHAVLQGGDALAFGGSLLHRTHVTPEMTQARLSVEFRLVGAAEETPRLADELRCPWTP
ncbi:MAG: hypothetical protein JNN18_16495 [Rubrivivax sp.]|jgi:hypothetical protein|nr:hypothetical protein [Rubrivivax sp.]